VKRPLTLLITGSLFFWLLTCYPVQEFGGESALVHSALAAILCLLPSVVSLVWVSRARTTPAEQLVAILGGTGLRLGVVLGVGLFLFFAVPYFQQTSFLLCLVLFYLVNLALEMALLVSMRSAASGRSSSEQQVPTPALERR
jgi:hypothetical protein